MVFIEVILCMLCSPRSSQLIVFIDRLKSLLVVDCDHEAVMIVPMIDARMFRLGSGSIAFRISLQVESCFDEVYDCLFC